ncbi:hypothetical protein Y032_0212g2255 [Ancylostoma ceylanicum]|nr:hypothetical protein Y032_0212g2255 [Ancylostoma ceylanicum]
MFENRMDRASSHLLRTRDQTYNEFQTVVDKSRDRGAVFLCVSAQQARCHRQPECPRRDPGPCLKPFGVHCVIVGLS